MKKQHETTYHQLSNDEIAQIFDEGNLVFYEVKPVLQSSPILFISNVADTSHPVIDSQRIIEAYAEYGDIPLVTFINDNVRIPVDSFEVLRATPISTKTVLFEEYEQNVARYLDDKFDRIVFMTYDKGDNLNLFPVIDESTEELIKNKMRNNVRKVYDNTHSVFNDLLADIDNFNANQRKAILTKIIAHK